MIATMAVIMKIQFIPQQDYNSQSPIVVFARTIIIQRSHFKPIKRLETLQCPTNRHILFQILNWLSANNVSAYILEVVEL